jgi:DNA polymerase/3'-5' exonuclease PolX
MANELIITEFEKLIRQIKIEIDMAPSTDIYATNNFRLKQITNSLNIIKNYPKKIKSGNDLKDIKGIGKGTIDRINEILTTGKLSEIKVTGTEDEFSKNIQELMQIHGIGHAKAFELITKNGIKTIKDLTKAHNDGIIDLNNIILTGLKYHNIYKENIPRNEVDHIKIYLERVVKTINKELNLTICGSYRRLRETSNDIDVLIYHPKIKTKSELNEQSPDQNYLLQFVKELKDNKFILDDLTDKDYKIKYMGYCQLDSKHSVRRIDMRYIPFDSYFTALCYFTGNASFNKKIRSVAEQLGYLLNEYGLYKLDGDKKVRIKITSERDIFEKLGMEYLPPEKRN